MTSWSPAGCVRIVFTLVIFNGGKPRRMALCAACKGVDPAAIVAASPAPPPVNIFSAFRRFILLLSSKRILQGELHLAIIDGGRGDPPERRVAQIGVRTGELRRVKQIESLNAELQTLGLLNAELFE